MKGEGMMEVDNYFGEVDNNFVGEVGRREAGWIGSSRIEAVVGGIDFEGERWMRGRRETGNFDFGHCRLEWY